MKVSYLFAVAVLAWGCNAHAPEKETPAPAESSQQALPPPAPREEAATTGAVTPSGPPKTVISHATLQKADETNANPDALVLQDFMQRIAAYVAIHKDAAKEAGKNAPKLKETDNAGDIKAGQQALAVKIGVMRASAKAGDIFTPEIRNKFRRLMYPETKGIEGSEAKHELKEDAPTNVPLKVNAPYPDGKPFPTVPPNILLNLPTLPEEVEYRIVDKHLILRDTGANIIVDYIPNAIH